MLRYLSTSGDGTPSGQRWSDLADQEPPGIMGGYEFM